MRWDPSAQLAMRSLSHIVLRRLHAATFVYISNCFVLCVCIGAPCYCPTVQCCNKSAEICFNQSSSSLSLSIMQTISSIHMLFVNLCSNSLWAMLLHITSYLPYKYIWESIPVVFVKCAHCRMPPPQTSLKYVKIRGKYAIHWDTLQCFLIYYASLLTQKTI